MPQVQRIDPIVLPSEKETVAAYCRVSTNSEDQLNSYNTQIAYYTKLISENPDWELADIYADSGITGTSIDKRDEFKSMLADCREGKIKRILVKSVSRFARNTTELLETTRELKDLGVVVVFEEQGFDSSQVLGEMQLTMYAMAAQEESNSISKNMVWSYQKRMSTGRFIGCKSPYGYKLANGSLEIVPSEMAVVKKIFEMHLSGIGIQQIAFELNKSSEMPRYKGYWTYANVRQILTNERYTGNAVLQKYYTVDSLKHIKRENKGACTKYYVKDSHQAIISQADFDQVQLLISARNLNRTRSTHLFTHKIICPDCHHYFRHESCSGKSYWECPHRAKKLAECRPFRITEKDIVYSAINLMVKLFIHHESILSPTIAHLREIEYTQTASDSKLFELDKSLAALNDKSLILQKLSAQGFISEDEYRLRNEKLAAERRKLTAERNKKLHGLQSHSAIEKLEELQAILSAWLGVPTEFDIEQFDEIVEKIIPTADNKLTFRLHCGLELTEDIPT